VTTLTRTITNIGQNQPLIGDDGMPLANAAITFLLVDANMAPTATIDTKTGSLVVAKEKVAITDANGEFSVDLWPTSRGKDQTYYLCRVARVFRFLAELPEGPDITMSLSWKDFMDPASAGDSSTYDDKTTIAYDDGAPVTP
jgi:hypothetical protein